MSELRSQRFASVDSREGKHGVIFMLERREHAYAQTCKTPMTRRCGGCSYHAGDFLLFRCLLEREVFEIALQRPAHRTLPFLL